MAAYTIKSFDTILSDWVAYVVAHSSEITDLTPGSVIRSFCEGGSLAIEELYIAFYLGFKRYLDSIQNVVFDFERKRGVKATVDVIFGRSGTSGDATISAGTRLLTPSGLRFILSSASIIANGNTQSAASEVEADEVGTDYNVASASITILEDDVDGVETVNNPSAAVGGVSEESVYSYKQRFQAYIEGLARSNIAGLIAGVLSLEGITSASVVELFPPVSNVNARVYIDDSSPGGVSSAKVAEAQGIIDGDGTESNPGYRSGGVNVVVTAPSTVSQPITMTVTPATGVDIDQMKVDVKTAVSTYINNLGIGGDIIYTELVSAVMSVFGVVDCDITVPSANITISDTQVGRAGVITVVVT